MLLLLTNSIFFIFSTKMFISAIYFFIYLTFLLPHAVRLLQESLKVYLVTPYLNSNVLTLNSNLLVRNDIES